MPVREQQVFYVSLLLLSLSVTDLTARNNAEAEDQNHMDSFLRNLHHRTQAIPGTPAAKRLKVLLSYYAGWETKWLRKGEERWGGVMQYYLFF